MTIYLLGFIFNRSVELWIDSRLWWMKLISTHLWLPNWCIINIHLISNIHWFFSCANQIGNYVWFCIYTGSLYILCYSWVFFPVDRWCCDRCVFVAVHLVENCLLGLFWISSFVYLVYLEYCVNSLLIFEFISCVIKWALILRNRRNDWVSLMLSLEINGLSKISGHYWFLNLRVSFFVFLGFINKQASYGARYCTIFL